MIMTVWKDVDEAKIKWPLPTQPHCPRTIEELIDEAYEMFEDDSIDYAFRAGFYFGIIQILKAERDSKKETYKD
jgi:hypothetical protein